MTIQDLIKDYNELRVGLQSLIHELECNYGPDYETEEGDNFAAAMYKFRDRAQTINKQMESLDLLHYGWYVGIKIHYRLSTNSYIINILSYTVLR